MSASAPTARSRYVEIGVALWVALWLVLGAWTGVEVWRLGELTSTVADSGRALDEAGRALQSLERLPVVGIEAADLGTQVRSNAADIVTSSADARGSFRRLAILLGVTIAFVPTVPAIAAQRVLRRVHLRQV